MTIWKRPNKLISIKKGCYASGLMFLCLLFLQVFGSLDAQATEIIITLLLAGSISGMKNYLKQMD